MCGKYECFVIQMLYVCVLCASCVSSQCCVLHDLQFVDLSSEIYNRPITKGISSCRNTQAFGPDKISIFHIKYHGSRVIEYLTALFNAPSHLVGSVDLEVIHCHPNPETRQGLLSAPLIGLSRSSVQQRKLWRLTYFPPSTTTCFHPQINAVSDPDTLPLLFCHN